jgi:competence protein ComFB
MEIRNLMEDAVATVVDELFEFEEREKRLGFCTCGQCRLDVLCYVLNRLKPEYVVSGRGVAYRERESLEKVQRRADIMSYAKEGWARVSHQPRPNADHHAFKMAHDLPVGPAFNFPTVMGRTFNGLNFEPFAAGDVSLYIDGVPAPMVDANWQNPYVLAQATAGTYLFWPRPLAAAAEGEERVFPCEVRVKVPDFDLVSHYFELKLRADAAAREEFSLQNVHKIQDLILFPPGTDADLEE